MKHPYSHAGDIGVRDDTSDTSELHAALAPECFTESKLFLVFTNRVLALAVAGQCHSPPIGCSLAACCCCQPANIANIARLCVIDRARGGVVDRV
jgi:hypothetical protein